MNSSQLVGIAMLAFLLATALYLALFLFRKKLPGLLGMLFATAGIIVLTASIALRWIESYQMGFGHAPLTNMYESFVFFSWCITLFYLIMEYKFKTRILGAFVLPFSFFSLAYASFSSRVNDEITPLIPALQSNWLIAHVVTCFIAYAAFAVACSLGLIYLFKGKSEKQENENSFLASLPDLKSMDNLIHKTLIFGFMWLTTGIITGSVWAASAWGTYWSNDSKEVWSLITWFIYAITLHIRFTRGLHGKQIAWLSILGFLSVLFTYLGVNFFLAGLHSYGAS